VSSKAIFKVAFHPGFAGTTKDENLSFPFPVVLVLSEAVLVLVIVLVIEHQTIRITITRTSTIIEPWQRFIFRLALRVLSIISVLPVLAEKVPIHKMPGDPL